MVSPRILILECGSDCASLGVFSQVGSRLRLHQRVVEKFPVRESAVSGGSHDQWLEQLRFAFRVLHKKAKFRGPAVLVLPAHLCLIKFIRVPRVGEIQQEKILRFEAEQAIPYALSDVVWGTAAVSETGTDTELSLAVAKLELLEALADSADEAGFRLHAVWPAPLATVTGFQQTAAGDGKSFLGLNIGTHSTTVVLAERERFILRTFSSDEIPGPEKIHQEIARSLLHFQWRTGMSKPAQAYVTGAGAAKPGFIEALGEKLKMPVDRCNPGKIFDAGPDDRGGNDAGGSSVDGLELAGAVAAYSDQSRSMINLLPPRLHEKGSQRRRRSWLMAAVLIIALAPIPPILHFSALRDEALRKSAAIEREDAPIRIRDSRIRKNLREIAGISERVHFLQIAQERRATWMGFLSGLQLRLGTVEDVWLEKLQLAPPVANKPLKLQASGRMLDRARPAAKVSPEIFTRVSALLEGLAGAPFVAGVESERFDNRQPGILQFDFTLVTDPQHPL